MIFSAGNTFILRCNFCIVEDNAGVAGLNSLTIGPDNIIRRLQGAQKEAAVVLRNRQRQKVGLTINVFVGAISIHLLDRLI